MEYRRKVPETEDDIRGSETRTGEKSDGSGKHKRPAYLGASSAKGFRPSENYEDVPPVEVDGRNISESSEPDETPRGKNKKLKNKRKKSKDKKRNRSESRKSKKSRKSGKYSDSSLSGNESFGSKKSKKSSKGNSDDDYYYYTSGSAIIAPKLDYKVEKKSGKKERKSPSNKKDKSSDKRNESTKLPSKSNSQQSSNSLTPSYQSVADTGSKASGKSSRPENYDTSSISVPDAYEEAKKKGSADDNNS